MHFKKAAVLGAALALALAGCGGGSTASSSDASPSGASDGDKPVLHVAVTDAILPFYYPWGVAQTQGFWKEEGLKVDILPGAEGSSAMMQQLIGGNADVAHPGPTVVFDAVKQGYADDLDVFGTWLYKQGFKVKVPEGSDVMSIDDLRGATIGISELSGGEVPILKATLEAKGLKEGDYTLLPIGSGEPQTINALKNGKVDAYCTAAKDFIAIEQHGVKFSRDITFPEWASLTANVFVTTKKIAQSRQKDLTAYLRGLIKAIVFTHNNRKAALAGMKEAYPAVYKDFDDKFSLQWMKLTEQRMYLPELVQSKALFSVDHDGLQGYVDFLQGIGDLDTKIDLPALIDDQIAQAANNFDYQSVK